MNVLFFNTQFLGYCVFKSKSMKILIVDDRRFIHQGLSKLLGFILPSYEFLESTNGCEALEIAKSIEIDLIILDVSMPGINGIQVLMQIKEIQPSSKVIILTQFDEPALIANCLAMGANAFPRSAF